MNFQDLLIIMVVVWIFGKFFRAMNLPVIFGELLGGIIVSPLVLGWVVPNETIHILAEFGVFFLMLHAGLETNPNDLFKVGKHAVWIGLGGVVVPFGLATGVSRIFGLEWASALFVGVGAAITAIAIASASFKNYKISNTRMAHLTLGSALIDDILGLVLFSVILEVAKSGTVDLAVIGFLTLKVAIFLFATLYLGHKYSKYLRKIIYKGNKGFTFTIIMALVFGLIAEAIGLHIIVGAFLAGIFVREEVIEEKAFKKIEDRIYGLSYSFLGPIFFASLAFHLDFSSLISNFWFVFWLTVVSIVGKFIGTTMIARLFKYSKYESLGIGIAMNNRGAVEFVIASIGLAAGIISAEVFSALITMAFITTIFSILALKPLVKYLKAEA